MTSLLHSPFSAAQQQFAAPPLMEEVTTPPRHEPGTSRLAQMQARFQQRQLQEKEQKLLHMLESQQERALQRVSRGSAGSSTSSSSSNSNSSNGGKVRLMFEEQRRNLGGSMPARRGGARSGPTTGYDRSYPLDPLSKTAPAGRLTARAPPQKPRVKPDNDVSLKPGKTLVRDTNANRLSPNDDLHTVFGKLANVGLRNGASNNNVDDDVTDAPPARKPLVKSLQEPKIRPAPAKRVEARTIAAPASKPAPSLVRRPTPPSPARSSGSSTTGSSTASPERRKPSAPASMRTSAAPSPAKPTPPANAGPIPAGMAECSMCSRRFAEDRISKHEDICRKTKTKKRKTFDPVKMRVAGTEVESYVKQAGKKSATPAAKKAAEAAAAKKNNWRKKHEEFIETIRNAKLVSQHIAAGGKASDLPAAKPLDTSDYVQCPHCQRKFSEGAAERHIPRCANIKSNKPVGRAPPRKR